MEMPPTPTPATTPETPAASAGNGVEGAYVMVDGTGGNDKPLVTETGIVTPKGEYVPDNPQKPVD